MITAEINDKQKRDVVVLPSTVQFGPLRAGGYYKTCIIVKNEDMMPQRIAVKNIKTPNIRIYSELKGPVSRCMQRYHVHLETDWPE
jgi:hypothetical protein